MPKLVQRKSKTPTELPIPRFSVASDLPNLDSKEEVKRWVRSRQRPWALDLFGGGGGLTLGLKKAGFSVLYAVDYDWLAVDTYRGNHSDVLSELADIREVDARKLRKMLGLRKGDLDLVAGCPPCQGFSRMRTLNGHRPVTDPRNDLIANYLGFIEEFLPKAVMLENVPGLASDKRFRDFTRRLKAHGYLPNFKILDAADYGVPQRRTRLILLAGLGQVLPFGERTDRSFVREAIAGLPLPGESGDPAHDMVENRSKKVMRLIRHIPKDGGSRSDAPSEFLLPCHKRCEGFGDVYGRMVWDQPAPTITSGCVNPSKGRFLHPEQDRCITVREAALLQGFPPNYFVSMRRGKFEAARVIGDALPPEFVARHATPVSTWTLNYESK